jgi:queuine tRNA-ribosyltransferase
MGIQALLGSDIAMAFDQCPPSDAPRADIEDAMARTTRWARRSLATPGAPGQLRFGIVQGGVHLDLRRRHLAELAAMEVDGLPFDGLALGGLGVGEAPAVMYEVIGAVASEMPEQRPRYLMGVGTPTDIWTAIGAGVDMFDCVMPTRNARNGQLFVRAGKLNIGNAQHREDARPVEEGCPCECCATYSRAYLAHLFHAEELLYYRLASIHNLQHYLDLARRARALIQAGGAFPSAPW